MQEYRPLVLQHLDIRLPGIRVQRLRLNRHLPDFDQVHAHGHPFAQFLVYLSGRGEQKVGDALYPVRPGTVFFLPPRQVHAFSEVPGRRPICLVIDFQGKQVQKKPRMIQLNQIDLAQVRQQLSLLVHEGESGDFSGSLRTSAAVLRLLEILIRASVDPAKGGQYTMPAIAQRVEQVLKQPEAEAWPLSRVAGEVGYQSDYLNRILKQATGLTLGQFRSRVRITRAQTLLKSPLKIQEVGEKLGFLDQNYFSRWFRQQTGKSPRDWRRHANLFS